MASTASSLLCVFSQRGADSDTRVIGASLRHHKFIPMDGNSQNAQLEYQELGLGAGEIISSGKHLTHKHKDLSLIPQNTHEKGTRDATQLSFQGHGRRDSRIP